MFARVTVTASDLAASRRFYETVLGDWPECFALEEGEPTRHLHVGFAAASREDVDAFWQRGVDAGHPSDGEPGPRPQYTPDYYGGFLLDPDGNSVEALYRPGRTEGGPPIDHLWLGVDDLASSRRFWEDAVLPVGLRVEAARWPNAVVVVGDQRHVMLVADGRPPTENVGIALTGPDGNAVEIV
jgi:catechol 2,3-dioxygenase-like lactoylglutathione lyase family enzyme